MKASVFVFGALSSFTSAVLAQGQDPLLDQFVQSELNEGNGASQGFLSPTGRFRVKIPGGFEQQEGTDPDTLIFNGQSSGYAVKLIFKRLSVTPGASSSQLMLTTRDRFLSKLANFTILKQGSAKIAGRQCATLIGRYDYQGNKGYPQIIENAYVVDGGDGFIIHFEVQEPGYTYAARDALDVYKSFKMIAPPQAEPVAPPPQTPPATSDASPKRPAKKR